jgi:HlyD family secretion protein
MKCEQKPIVGSVRSISRDSMIDAATSAGPSQPYFAVEVSVDRNSIPEDIRDRMIAGMTVDIIIRTQSRTVLSYLVAPLTNRLSKSLRERLSLTELCEGRGVGGVMSGWLVGVIGGGRFVGV